ncbi:MAG: fatty acid desaturase [Verrucomicrobiota bacterium]
MKTESYFQVAQQLSKGIEEEIRALHHGTWKHHLIYLCYPSMLLFGMTLSAMAESWWSYGIGLGLTVLAMNACFLLIHEATHGLLCPNRSANRWLAVVLSGFGFVSYSAYRAMHLQHHTHLGDENDPDDYANYTDKKWLIWFLHYNRLLWATILYTLVLPGVVRKRGTREDVKAMTTEYMILLPIYVLVFLTVPLALLFKVWLMPFILTNFMINIRGLSQHGIADAQDPLLASRSIEAGPLVRFCFVNENYHLEHHLFPGVPAFNLHRLHRLIKDRLPRKLVNRSYGEFLRAFFKATLKRDESPIGLVTREKETNV